jgi:hypothetical protein
MAEKERTNITLWPHMKKCTATAKLCGSELEGQQCTSTNAEEQKQIKDLRTHCACKWRISSGLSKGTCEHTQVKGSHQHEMLTSQGPSNSNEKGVGVLAYTRCGGTSTNAPYNVSQWCQWAFLIEGRNNWKEQEARALQRTVSPSSQLTSAGAIAWRLEWLQSGVFIHLSSWFQRRNWGSTIFRFPLMLKMHPNNWFQGW